MTPLSSAQLALLAEISRRDAAWTAGPPTRMTLAPHDRRALIRLLNELLPPLTDALRELTAERDRCHERLEIDYVWQLGASGEFEKTAVPLEERGRTPDGIECRDATISELQKALDEECALRPSNEIRNLVVHALSGSPKDTEAALAWLDAIPPPKKPRTPR